MNKKFNATIQNMDLLIPNLQQWTIQSYIHAPWFPTGCNLKGCTMSQCCKPGIWPPWIYSWKIKPKISAFRSLTQQPFWELLENNIFSKTWNWLSILLFGVTFSNKKVAKDQKARNSFVTFLGWLSDPFKWWVKWPPTRGWKGHWITWLLVFWWPRFIWHFSNRNLGYGASAEHRRM